MSAKKPSESEEEYFAREEAEKQRQRSIEQARVMAHAEREALKALHFMHCPKCGFDLQSMTFRDLKIERCYNCHGTWLDEGELEALAGREPGLLSRIAAVFRPGE